MPTAAARRARQLMSDHDAVAIVPLGNVESIVARNAAGELELAECYRQGQALHPADAADELGEARRQALLAADAATNHLIANLALRHAAGEDLNMAALSRTLGIARSTLYLRLSEAPVAAREAAAA